MMIEPPKTTEKKSSSKSRFCGNCHYHDAYEYPDFILCKQRYPTNKNFIVSTLGCCDKWTPHSQECFCVKEALEKQNKKPF